MAKSLGGFRTALAAGWVALAMVGLLLARVKGIPILAALPVIAAFLAEYPFYLAAGFPAARNRLAGPKLPVLLLASGLLPYLIFSLGAGEFQWLALMRLAALMLMLSLWYRVLPAGALTDAAFLLMIAFVILAKYFNGIFPVFFGQKISILGSLALFHVSVLALILERRMQETGYGFWPARRDWLEGALHYLYFLALGGPLAVLLHAVHFTKAAPVWLIVAIFFGFLWVVALAEEFLFRGVLQQWIENWTGRFAVNPRTAALVLTSLLFGTVHLWFRGFPNWRWALIATVLGLACGHARNRTGGIRAGVVTHALVVATWRAFFF